MRQLFGHKRMPKKFGSKQDKINGTSFTKCHSGHNRSMNIGELFLNCPWKCLGIFEQYMSQGNYQNYLGILGWTEI